MKANRTHRLYDDKRAQVGIGTMIVFIATILVAAAAAALLLDTSGKLQERSSKTGSEATKEVASNLIVKSLYGTRADDTSDISNLTISVSLAPGASAVDLAQAIITYSDGSALTRLGYGTTANATLFSAEEARDPQGTFTTTSPVMSSGALVDLKVNLNAMSSELSERTDVSVQIIPESGTPVTLSFTTPASYGTNTVVTLR